MLKFRYRKYVKREQNRLYSIAMHMLGHSGEAEDVVQDTFIKLWDHLPDMQDEHVVPWLIRVARNACLDVLRRRKYQEQLLGDDAIPETSDEVTPASDMEQADVHRRLRDLIEQLSEPYRSLIILREIQEMAYQEIATALELTDQQVRVYLHRARAKLRKLLQNDDAMNQYGEDYGQATQAG